MCVCMRDRGRARCWRMYSTQKERGHEDRARGKLFEANGAGRVES